MKRGDITVQEETEGEFLDTFNGLEDVVVLTATGYGCECGEYPGNLGYSTKRPFSEVVLDILDADIDVSIGRT